MAEVNIHDYWSAVGSRTVSLLLLLTVLVVRVISFDDISWPHHYLKKRLSQYDLETRGG